MAQNWILSIFMQQALFCYLSYLLFSLSLRSTFTSYFSIWPCVLIRNWSFHSTQFAQCKKYTDLTTKYTNDKIVYVLIMYVSLSNGAMMTTAAGRTPADRDRITFTLHFTGDGQIISANVRSI